jgi:beta-1,4-mannosyl-glycoprotein beta-1,4-N-acetylglucosaminyltransferase
MIIDTCLFSEDFNALEIRLAELYDVVDLFVICESKFTFTGLEKPLYLSKNFQLFNKYKNKIHILVEDKKHLTKFAFIRETYQRKKISQFLDTFDIRDSDLIIYSDCDEIPKSSVIQKLSQKKNVNAILEFRMFSNYLNTFSGSWLRARAVSGNLYRNIESLRQDVYLLSLTDRKYMKRFFTRVPIWYTTRNFYLWKLPKFYRRSVIEVIPDAGWHFNNLYSKQHIIRKLSASAHINHNNSEIIYNLSERLKYGQDIYTGKNYKVVDIDETFPHEIINNIGKWDKYIFR